jgi:hypothetical protein
MMPATQANASEPPHSRSVNYFTVGTYLEIKGYCSPQAEAKFAAFPRGLIAVRRENMQFVFDYVIQTYGKNFARLYE